MELEIFEEKNSKYCAEINELQQVQKANHILKQTVEQLNDKKNEMILRNEYDLMLNQCFIT